MSLFGKEFSKEGEQAKMDFDGSGQFFFQSDGYGNEGVQSGRQTSAFGFGGGPSGYGGLGGQSGGLGQNSSMGNLAAANAAGGHQPLFNRGGPQGAPAGLRPGGAAGAVGGLGAPAVGMSGLGSAGLSAGNSAVSTPARPGLPPSLAGMNGSNPGGPLGNSGLSTPGGLSGGGNLRGLLNLNASTPGGLSMSGGASGTEEDFGLGGGLGDLEDAVNNNSMLGGDLLSGGGMGRPTPSLFPPMSASTPGPLGLATPGSAQNNDLLSSSLSSLSLGPSGLSAQQQQQANSKDHKYGLLAFVQDVMRADKESQQLNLGIDLSSFGLNLAAIENLFPSFTSPFTEAMFDDQRPYKVPSCYPANPAAFKVEYLNKLSPETLFYIFYYLPRDVLQTLAAVELYRREWRYHGELKVWLKQRSGQELLQIHPNVQFVYFDPKSFDVRLFNATGRGNVMAGLLTEDVIRMSLSPQALSAVTNVGPSSASGGPASLSIGNDSSLFSGLGGSGLSSAAPSATS